MGQAVERVVIDNMDLFFNELSVKEAANKQIAMQWMDNLVAVYKKVFGKGFKELKTTATFINITLAPNYKLIDWLHDYSVDSDIRLLFKTKISKSPFIETLLIQKNDEEHRLHEFKYKNSNAAGLGAAYLFDSLAVSFDNSSEWDRHLVELTVSEYSEDDQIIQSIEEVKHSSKLEHIDRLNEWIVNKKKFSIANGKLLWLKRKELFPHLVFCKSIENHVCYLRGSEPEFHIIVKRLFELETFCATWKSGIFTGENFPSKVTYESESRRLKFKGEMTMICPDGEFREFFWHLRYTPGSGRLHFAPDNSKKIIHIGYIGPKIQ